MRVRRRMQRVEREAAREAVTDLLGGRAEGRALLGRDREEEAQEAAAGAQRVRDRVDVFVAARRVDRAEARALPHGVEAAECGRQREQVGLGELGGGTFL